MVQRGRGVAAQYVPQLAGAGTPSIRSARYCTVPPRPVSIGTAWLITSPVATGLVINHAVPMLTGLGGTVQYLADRIDGVPAPANCGTY